MLKDHIQAKLIEFLDHEPTPGQILFNTYLPDFLLQENQDEVLVLKGYAGTGKTTSIKAMVKTLEYFHIRSVLMAPTGRAAKVMTAISGSPAYTIHKKIYRQKSSKDGFGVFALDRNLYKNTFFIVDEASMISNEANELSIFGSGKLLDDLLYYVYSGKNCKLILVGDTAQLPPVGKDTSPALNITEIKAQGFVVHECFFNEVIRQSSESGILFNATLLREKLKEKHPGKVVFTMKGFDDIQYLPGSLLLDELSDCYNSAGTEDTMVIVRSNKQANMYNAGIRSQILWKEERISTGDLLMVVKNNYFYSDENEQFDFIANGDIVKIKKIFGYEERYGYRFADVRIQLVDYDETELDVKLLLDTLDLEAASLASEAHKDLFFSVAEDYASIKSKKKRYEEVRNDLFFNALQVKFAYAITCHKAQGGQWKNVFIDHGYFVDDMYNREYLRWLYTAFTRATDKLYLVNFNKSFFREEDIE